MAKKPPRTSVKLPTETYELARELATLAARQGWAHFGSDREDPATIMAVLDEGTRVLAQRVGLLKAKGKAR